jgi:hypothetical protein
MAEVSRGAAEIAEKAKKFSRRVGREKQSRHY